MPRFTPDPATRADETANRLAESCARLAARPGSPPMVPLIAWVRKPLPLGLGRFLGLSRVALGRVPDVQGWAVRWSEAGRGGAVDQVGYLVTPSGRAYLLGRQGTIAMFSDRSGFPPQPNPVTPAQADRIEQCLLALSGASRDRSGA
ncbi:hypothetical protein [Nostocoides sp. HKS02]|uniref:hypothetical protein n=1 Tax=Nostocoides sp. HKS02 TaxID=1813880 RepID=UPI0012B4F303|nr:hypothetical protein [Tetrasphaera sp. HKS02]QGN57942.1 hypothetical protein GKE56_08665 [Tetrasphaera sp. HKS02]